VQRALLLLQLILDNIMIRHCIIDTNTNLVVNIVEYGTLKTGVPEGLESHLLCVASETGDIGGTYENGTITNPPQIEVPPTPDPLNKIQMENA